MNDNLYLSTLYNLTYNEIYRRYQLLSDQVLIENWKYHQHQAHHKDDYHWIAFSVCEDLLRQRENTYLDDTYPKD
ncbi:hypothetical protein HMPREF9467_00786 [ [[Clostridium] clostridioforme 2_1_49FAA]|nr:hypothetical protein HMPREF9467_00786 [ [[Clostridium] clostridioforme 2_1_49FAA]